MNTSHCEEQMRALAIVAHPDDVEYAAGGTIAGWVTQGWEVTLCVVTDGQRGVARPLSADRKAEQATAAKELGIEQLRFLGYMDAEVTPTLELRAELADLLRLLRPHRVLTHSPRYAWAFPPTSHPDHRAVGAATLDAVYPGASTPSSAGGTAGAPWQVHEVWLFGDPEANHFEDVTDHLARKLAALRCHDSQRLNRADDEPQLRSRMAGAARHAGLPDGRLAERFQILKYV